MLSHVRRFATPWTVTQKAPRSMRFSRQEYWGGLSFPSPGDLPDPGIKPHLLIPPPSSRGLGAPAPRSSRFFTTEPTWEPQSKCTPIKINLPKAMGRFKSLNSSLILLEYASKPPEEAYDLRGIDHTAEVCSIHGSCYETAYFCLSFCFFLTLHTFLMYTQTL